MRRTAPRCSRASTRHRRRDGEGVRRQGQRQRPAQRRGLGRSLRHLRPLLEHLFRCRRPHPLWRHRRRLRCVARCTLPGGAVRRLQHLPSVHAGFRLHADRQSELGLRPAHPHDGIRHQRGRTWQAMRLGVAVDLQIVPGPEAERRCGLPSLRALQRHRRSHPARRSSRPSGRTAPARSSSSCCHMP